MKKRYCVYDISHINSYTSFHKALILKEEAFDGFYAVCTNLDDASEIIKVNHRRWEIEECFRIMKSEFKARPVYLSNDDRIEAHFTTCFISLIIYRLLEKRLNEKYTCHEIIAGLKDMNFHEVKGEGYTPTYTRTDFTDSLHEAFGFRTDYEIVNTSQMKKILKKQKNKKHYSLFTITSKPVTPLLSRDYRLSLFIKCQIRDII
jgi:hypothetical protein